MAKNYYEILGVDKEADKQQIRQAYRSLAMQWHPDKNQTPEAHERFAEINQAHETLSDPFKRKFYDLRLQLGVVLSGRTPWTGKRPVSPEEQKWHYWQSKAGQQRKKELKKEEAIFSGIGRVLRWVAFFSLALGIVLFIEKYFPASGEKQVVTNISLSSKAFLSGELQDVVNVNTREDYFQLDFKIVNCIRAGDTLSIYRGRILGLISAIQLSTYCEDAARDTFDPKNGLFAGAFVLVYIIVCASLAAILVTDKFIRAGLGVINFLFFIVILIMVLDLLSS